MPAKHFRRSEVRLDAVDRIPDPPLRRPSMVEVRSQASPTRYIWFGRHAINKARQIVLRRKTLETVFEDLDREWPVDKDRVGVHSPKEAGAERGCPPRRSSLGSGTLGTAAFPPRHVAYGYTRLRSIRSRRLTVASTWRHQGPTAAAGAGCRGGRRWRRGVRCGSSSRAGSSRRPPRAVPGDSVRRDPRGPRGSAGWRPRETPRS